MLTLHTRTFRVCEQDKLRSTRASDEEQIGVCSSYVSLFSGLIITNGEWTWKSSKIHGKLFERFYFIGDFKIKIHHSEGIPHDVAPFWIVTVWFR